MVRLGARGGELSSRSSRIIAARKYCVGVGNGLEALHLILRAYGIGPGDEVIVPSNTYIATWLAVSYAGATPVPVEPDPQTFNLDPARDRGRHYARGPKRSCRCISTGSRQTWTRS